MVDERLEHRVHRQLELEEQWIVVGAHVQPDVGRHADAADAHHLASEVDQGESIEEQLELRPQRLAIGREALPHRAQLGLVGDPHHQRRVLPDLPLPVHELGELRERADSSS